MLIDRKRSGSRHCFIFLTFIAMGFGVCLSLFLGSGSAVVEAVHPDTLVSEYHVSGDWGYGLDSDGNAVITDYYGNDDEIVLDDQIDGHTIIALGRSRNGRLFQNYQTLKKITLPDTIISLDHAFVDCDQLSEIILPNHLKEIGDYSFFECSALVTIDLPATVEVIGEKAFSRCGLPAINLPQSLKAIKKEAFAESSLENIVLPKGLEKLDSSAFRDCHNGNGNARIPVQIEEGNPNFYVEEGVLYDCDKKEVILALNGNMSKLELEEGIQRINPYAFERCCFLQVVSLPDTLEYIGEEAFSGLYDLQNFTIPKGVTEIGEEILRFSTITKLDIKASIKDLKNICRGCHNLEQVSLPEGLETVSGFSECSSLMHISLPDSVKTIEKGAFWNSGLRSITIPAGTNCIEETALSSYHLTEITVEQGNSFFYTKPDGLYNREGVLLVATAQSGEVQISENCRRIGALAFRGRNQIQKVRIPDSVKEIGQDAFCECEGLTSVEIGKQLEKIELGAFAGLLSNIREITWEDGVCYLGSYAISYHQPESFSGVLSLREGCTLIADHCFENIDSLEYLFLPDSLQYIGDYAFSCDYALKEIIGGKDLAAIGEGAFWNSGKLERLYLRGEKIKIGKYAFDCSNVSELMVDAQEVELSKHCFYAVQECRTIVLPNLNIPVRQVFSISFYASMAKLLLTNMSAESLKEQGDLFDGCHDMCLYLPFSDNELKDQFSKRGVSVFNRDKWQLCRFMVYGAMKQLSILSRGEPISSPVIKGNVYNVTPCGPKLSNIQWDLNEDGIPDELPSRANTDIKAEALYQISELPHKQHNWQVKEILQKQTCIQPGNVLYYCSGCGEEKEESLEALGHSFSGDWIIDQEATCTEMGTKSHHCIREGCTERDDITQIPMAAHIWDAGVITIQPQIGVAGEKVFTCSICKSHRKEEIAALPVESTIPQETPTPTESAVPQETPMPTESAVPQETLTPTESAVPLETPPPTETASSASPSPTGTPVPTPTLDPTELEPTVFPAVSASPQNSPLPSVQQPTSASAGTGSGAVPSQVTTETPASTTNTKPPNLSTPAPLRLSGLKATTDHYTKVKLTWNSIPGTSYQIYRSTSRNSGYKQIKKKTTKTRYQDTSVKSGKTYYYQVKAVKTAGGKQIVQAESQTLRIKIRSLARPVVRIQRRQTGSIRYLLVQVKKYQGKYMEIYYKDSKWSAYRKIKLYENRIKKQKQAFRIQCMSTGKNLYLRMRTYTRKKGKKIYSSYTKEKRIKV